MHKEKKIKVLAQKNTKKFMTLPLDIDKETDISGIGMGVLSDGTPYLNQAGLSRLCGVRKSVISDISNQWDEEEQKPRIKEIKSILDKMNSDYKESYFEITHKGATHYCYPADICISILEYYAFQKKEVARDNYRILSGHKLREFIYDNVGYDPTGKNQHAFDKWHERIALNYQSAPNGFFHIFNEINTIIYELIAAGANIGEKFIVDISVGNHWAKYWTTRQNDKKYRPREKYPHNYPDSHPQSKSNPQNSWCYPIESLPEFRLWLQNEYIEGGKFKGYLDSKIKKSELSPSIAQLAIDTLIPEQIEDKKKILR